MPISFSPISAATDTTSRLVEVPIVVPIPPNSVARPIGISTLEGERPVRIATLTRIGSSRTTIGVLLTKALRTAASTSVSNSDSCGQRPHSLDRIRPSGSSAPVRTSPCPATISAHTATNAWWPNPENRATALSFCSPPLWNGKSVSPNVNITNIIRLELSSGMRSREKSSSAMPVSSRIAKAWRLGSSGKVTVFNDRQVRYETESITGLIWGITAMHWCAPLTAKMLLFGSGLWRQPARDRLG